MSPAQTIRHCRVCDTKKRVELCRLIMRSGSEHIGWRCGDHWAGTWISKKMVEGALSHPIFEGAKTIQDLPWAKQEHDIPCSYGQCSSIDVEYHHFAPQEFFIDSEHWPCLPLCKKHHTRWHQTLKDAGLKTKWGKHV